MEEPLQRRGYNTSKRCQICRHSERVRIEALYVAGVSLDRIAARFDVHRDSIHRHASKHMSDAAKASYLIGPARIAELAEIAAEENRSLVEYLAILRSTLFGRLDRLAAVGNDDGVARLSGPLLQTLKAIGRVTGEINSLAASTIIVNNNTTILNSAPFADLQVGLLRVCAAHPEARADVVDLLRRLDMKYGAPQLNMIDGAPAKDAAHV